MICLPCQKAAYQNSLHNLDKAQKLHTECKGDCGCQHRTGPGWYARAGEKVPAMRTQSP